MEKKDGAVGSPAAFCAQVGLYEKDVDLEFIPARFANGQHKSPKYLVKFQHHAPSENSGSGYFKGAQLRKHIDTTLGSGILREAVRKPLGKEAWSC
ncbi:hypothetical protein Tco_1331337, partial [Tanacetum coccineum]